MFLARPSKDPRRRPKRIGGGQLRRNAPLLSSQAADQAGRRFMLRLHNPYISGNTALDVTARAAIRAHRSHPSASNIHNSLSSCRGNSLELHHAHVVVIEVTSTRWATSGFPTNPLCGKVLSPPKKPCCPESLSIPAPKSSRKCLPKRASAWAQKEMFLGSEA